MLVTADKELALKDIQDMQTTRNFFFGIFKNAFGKDEAEKLTGSLMSFFETGLVFDYELEYLGLKMEEKSFKTHFEKQKNNLPKALQKIGGLGELKILITSEAGKAKVRGILEQTPAVQAIRLAESQTDSAIQAAQRSAEDSASNTFLAAFGFTSARLFGNWDAKNPPIIVRDITWQKRGRAWIEKGSLRVIIRDETNGNSEYMVDENGTVYKHNERFGWIHYCSIKNGERAVY